MKCPNCSNSIHFEPYGAAAFLFEEEEDRGFDVVAGLCPSCGELIALYREGNALETTHRIIITDVDTEEVIYPRAATRPVDAEVPDRYSESFKEAASVMSLSPKASAALSRRLLQEILREEVKVAPANLSKEIEEFIAAKDTPGYLATAVDAVRNVGNFAAHPLKDTNTGEIVDVEPGEAEWLLEVVESLFDFVFVQPARLESRKQELNEKLKRLGKPEMKGS